MSFKSSRFYRIVYFSVILTCILGFTFGYIYTSSKMKNIQVPKETESYQGVNIKESENLETENVINQNIGSDVNFIRKTYYIECQHTILQNSKAPKDILNLTEDEFKLAYKDWQVDKFSPVEIIVSKTINGKCPNHYIVKQRDRKVTVFYQEPVAGVSLKELTNIDVSSLSKTDQDRLIEGIIVDSNEKLAELLEDLGS